MQAAQPIHGTLDHHVDDFAHALELLVFPIRQPACMSNSSNIATAKVRSPLHKVQNSIQVYYKVSNKHFITSSPCPFDK